MNTNEKYTLADEVIKHAIKCGAEQVSATILDNRSTEIEIGIRRLTVLKIQTRESFDKHICGQEVFVPLTNRMKKEELFRFIEEAVAATRYLAVDEYRALPDPDLYYKGGGPELNTYDPAIETLDAKSKIDLANQVLNEAYNKDERIISVSSYSDNLTSRVKVTSNGFRGDSKTAMLHW